VRPLAEVLISPVYDEDNGGKARRDGLWKLVFQPAGHHHDIDSHRQWQLKNNPTISSPIGILGMFRPWAWIRGLAFPSTWVASGNLGPLANFDWYPAPQANFAPVDPWSATPRHFIPDVPQALQWRLRGLR
jgi:hypothetical protein